MINQAVLIARIREKQSKFALAAVQYPTSDLMIYGVNAGKWQGLEIAIELIEEMLNEDDEANK